MSICIFCFGRPPPGLECTYGLHHEFPKEKLPVISVGGTKESGWGTGPTKKPDAKLCVKCGIHPKNPLFASNGCEHLFGDGVVK